MEQRKRGRIVRMQSIVGSLIALAMLPSAALAAGSTSPASPALSASLFGGLQPGHQVMYTERVPINVVFIGYKPAQVKRKAFLDALPGSSKPAVRDPGFWGFSRREVGLRYDYDYRVSYASDGLANRFFAYLTKIGLAGELTPYQLAYNDQASNVLDIAAPNLYVDGTSVEDWLSQNLGVGPAGDTVVFINWYGRADFRFHVYYEAGSPDPDTGVDLGYSYAAMGMAWGGAHHALWFYDLSAGPEWNTINWEVDDKDLGGDGLEDYRMPPIWEYVAGGFRSPSKLTSDLALITRYTALDSLFTASPYADPEITAPGVGGKKIVEASVFEADPDTSGIDQLQPAYYRALLADVEPYYDWETPVVDHAPADPGAMRAWRIAAGLVTEDDCWNQYVRFQSETYCYFDTHRSQYFSSYGPADSVERALVFNVTDADANPFYAAWSDDNWTDGTQSFVFVGASTSIRAVLGTSTFTAHESGHFNLGLSHPHDAFDPSSQVDFNPYGGPFFFDWVGDESATTMSYLFTAHSFDVFDKANARRWEMADYLNLSNDLAGRILHAPGALGHLPALLRADRDARQARDAFAAWDFLTAATRARAAFVELATVAAKLGVPVPTSSSAAEGLSTGIGAGAGARTRTDPGDLELAHPLAPGDPTGRGPAFVSGDLRAAMMN